jgi:orotate phosphoribosyltransferase-like protein
MSKKSTKNQDNNTDVWTDEQYEEYLKNLYGIDFIVGYTENGVPYGAMIDENNEMDELITKDSSLDSNEEEPF